ncbi:DUF1775 domain-containing protein [Cohnella pontilimi]|uniref:DUF1775 domain-containing protein n=1 Tax=Cohnella pontilimi TaxID=2564100 RepID=A0A4U0F8P0_9BACL|nr:YcnI family protein [Cohnella pontilimi]TJY41001.1 DUF1775 domain-containing protein [Cohnella pontilimi]
MKKSLMVSLVLLFTLAFAGAASAHVTVQPKEVPANSYQVFTLRVPTEKDVATTQVKVEVPAGVDVSRLEPKPDWTYELEKNADGKIVSVTWKTAGKGLSATEFGQFLFQGKVAADAKELTWKAYQTYADGSVVEWTGAPDADKPASVTTVTVATGAEDHGHGAATDTTTAANADDTKSTWTLVLSAAALVVSLIALFLVVRKKA